MKVPHFLGKEKYYKRKTLAFFSWTMVVAYNCANLDCGLLGYTGQATVLSLRYYYDSNLYNL